MPGCLPKGDANEDGEGIATMGAFGWELKGDGRRLASGEVVAPGERLAWTRTVGLGAQHVVAMFGATFVFPLLMGLNAQLAIMMSGVATIIFLLVVSGRVPSYLGTSASFVGVAAAIRAQPGADSSTVTGAILVGGVLLAAVGLVVHLLGAGLIHRILPPVVTGAVVMLIGFNLAPVVANVYWPQDQWVALTVMTFAIVCAVALKGFLGRISIFLSLAFGYVLSWSLDQLLGPLTSFDPAADAVTTHWRVNLDGVASAPWVGFPPQTSVVAGNEVAGIHGPTFSLAAVLVVIPAIIALIAENTGHVKAVAEMTGADLDDVMGRAIGADGVATVVATSVGGSPTTTYAENIGVMAATRIYSTAAYYVAALIAIVVGLSPKFGALVAATPGGVLGGITVVLYGMIGLLGAKIWKENDVDFANPVNLVPVAAGVVIGIGDTTLAITPTFELAGIALGTIVTITAYHLARVFAHEGLREVADGSVLTVGHEGIDRVADEGPPRAPRR
jgi:uracil-xanthine permease